MSAGFALLRAPQVVQTQILNMCKPQEIVNLSFCSKRAYNLARMHRKKPENGELVVLQGVSSLLTIKYPDEKCSSNYELTFIDGTPMNKLIGFRDISYMPNQAELINIGDTKCSAAVDSNGILDTFGRNRVHGAKTVIDHVSRLFNMDIDNVSINTASLWMIDWVDSRQDSLKKASIFDYKPISSHKKFRNILTNCKPTEELNVEVEAPANFRFTGEFQKPDVLSINSSRWVTLDNLKAMDSINIFIEISLLTSSDINLFLKHWLAGGSLRLRYMKVGVVYIAFNVIFQDLIKVQVPEKRQFKLLDGTVQHFSDAYDIQREDGVKASVLLSQQWNRLDGSVEEFSNAYDIRREDGVKASVLLSDPWNLSIFVWPADE